MIGVLAVIAILTAMLIPKVFESINSARINDAAAAVATMKSAVATHFGKYGSFADSTGAPFIADADLATNADALAFDTLVLMKDKMIEKRFAVKVGDKTTNTKIQVRQIESAADHSEITGVSASYDIDGVEGVIDTNDGALVVEAIITGVSAADAKAIKERIDGSDLTTPIPALNQPATLGKVKYPAILPGAVGDLTVYVAHR